ncbi:P-loop containing nucleoside triphosphate hydrolase protein [Mycena galopus ATCC 62051]|nr:P-loop containing nucleoside triphosphate hydrolase protein [Mycena galopus ATCC 62051]
MATADATQLSESQYALHRKDLLALMNQLRAVGAQGDLDLPRITVIGNQSAVVPRDAGTCTRCPMECRLSSSTNSWPFGHAITNKDEVEIALRRAQFAVLNPSVSFGKISEMSARDLKNGVPGIIANAEQEVVDLVEEMVVSHIRGNHCLILVALPMTDDIENQKALRLARQEDPEGKRTIGVLTKPDMLSTGSNVRNLWLDVIEGRKHPLMHGYFCTRQPDDDERGRNITANQARLAETDFFTTTAPWSTATQKDRFGTDNLVATLSTLLVQIINDGLPEIRRKANDSMIECRRQLEALPVKVVGEPATHMLNLITAFCTDIRLFVDGQSDMSALIHERNTAFAEFKHSINKTQPQFIARVPGQAGTHGFPIQIDNEAPASATDLIASQKPVYLPDIRLHIARSITRELPGNIPFSAKKTLITAFQQTWLACAVNCFNSVKQSMLALLMRCVDEKFGRYLPLQKRLKACITEMAGKYFESCGTFLMAMLEVEQMPYTQNDHYLSASTEKWLSRYKDERAGKKRTSSEAGLEGSVSSRPPSPSNELVTDSEKINNVLAQLAELGYTGIAPEDFGKLRPVDEFETEITVMSEVRGYFQRVIDNIPALIDAKFLRAIAQNLQQELISEFGLGSEDANTVCAALLVEDPIMVARREEWTARSRRLEDVQIQLHNFGLKRTAQA